MSFGAEHDGATACVTLLPKHMTIMTLIEPWGYWFARVSSLKYITRLAQPKKTQGCGPPQADKDKRQNDTLILSNPGSRAKLSVNQVDQSILNE
ncbi:MAG: hypothetical protein AAGF24_13370 [Cyanobacteria bacterium P01_H01_bin.121]